MTTTTKQDVDNLKTGIQDQMAMDTFVNNLIDERKDSEITPATRPALYKLLMTKVNEAINEHFVSLLNDEEVKELDKLLTEHIPDKQLNDFFRSKIDNISVEIATALLNFREAYLYPMWKKQQEDAAKAAGEEQQNAEPKQQKEEQLEELDALSPAPVA